MKKNGFVLIETIIVMSILAIGLISLYSSYVLIVRKTLSNSYEKPKDTYLAYQIAKKINLTPLGLVATPYYEEISLVGNSYKQRECGLDASNKATCSIYEDVRLDDNYLYDTLGISKIYFINRSADDLYLSKILLTFDGSTINYLNNIRHDESFLEDTAKTIVVKVKSNDMGYEFSYYQE